LRLPLVSFQCESGYASLAFFAAIYAIDARARRRIAQHSLDESVDGLIVALDVDLDCARCKIAHRSRDWEVRCMTRDGIPKADSLHATVQLENDAPYALTSARAVLAARNNMPLSPEYPISV
jgi:hypothetical protein